MVETLAAAPPAPLAPAGRSASAVERRRELARLYRTHGPMVYRRCLRLLRNPAAAADATQEVFVKLVEELPALSGRESLVPWLCRTSTNRCLNLLRSAHRHREETLEGAPELPARGPLPGAIDGALARRLLARFDDTTRAIAVGILVDGLGQEELSSELGLSRRTIGRKLDRFLARAHRYLVVGAVALPER